MAATAPAIEIEVGDREVRVTNPDRVYFPARGETKRDLVKYYLGGRRHRQRAARAAVHAAPFPYRASTGEKVHQKRLPAGAPPWMETVRLLFPRWKRTADELCVTELAQRRSGRSRCRRWSSTPGTADAPTPRSPTSGASTSTRCRCARSTTVRRVAHVAHEVLDELGAVGWPKTSGGKGLHIYVRIDPTTASETYVVPHSPSPARWSVARRRRHDDVVAQGP